MSSKKSLAVFLSRLESFKNPSIREEQHPTDSEVAATVLWHAYMQGDIEDKTIADLGAGTGVLGIGALMLGAKKVYFVEKDKAALEICKKNIPEDLMEKSVLLNIDFESFDKTTDLVIQNPPFGTKIRHADKPFLEKAFKTSNKIYTFHKTSTAKFIEAIVKDFDFDIIERIDLDFPLKRTQSFHKNKIKRIEVSCWILEKNC